MVGLHSPFGIFGQIKDKRGLTTRQLLWGGSWITFLLESADAPHYLSGREVEAEPLFASAEEFARWLEKKKQSASDF